MLLPFAVLIFAATFIGFGVVDAHAEEVASLVCSKHAIAGAKPYGRSVSFSQENETERRVHSQNNKYKNVHWTLDKSSDPWKFIGTPEIGIWRFELEQFEPQWFTGEAINKEGARVRSCDLTFPVALPVLEERNSPQKQKSSDHARDVIGSKSSAEPAQALSGTKTIERLEEAGPPIIDTVPAYWRKAGLFIGKAIFKFVRSEKYVEKEWVEKNIKLKFRTFAGTEEKLDGKVALYVEGSMKFDCNDRSYVAVHWRGRNVQKKAISYGWKNKRIINGENIEFSPFKETLGEEKQLNPGDSDSFITLYDVSVKSALSRMYWGYLNQIQIRLRPASQACAPDLKEWAGDRWHRLFLWESIKARTSRVEPPPAVKQWVEQHLGLAQ